jgi:hypothetical protein
MKIRSREQLAEEAAQQCKIDLTEISEYLLDRQSKRFRCILTAWDVPDDKQICWPHDLVTALLRVIKRDNKEDKTITCPLCRAFTAPGSRLGNHLYEGDFGRRCPVTTAARYLATLDWARERFKAESLQRRRDRREELLRHPEKISWKFKKS